MKTENQCRAASTWQQSPALTPRRAGLSLVVAGAVLSLAPSSWAATGTANASAEVIGPITITDVADLSFGRFTAGAGGTVIIATDGSRTSSGDVTLYSGLSAAAAEFNVTGLNGASYDITLPGNGTVTLSDGASATMAVDSFVSNPTTTGVLTGGSQSILVGATLGVANGQTPGSYTGTFDVTVEYN